MKVTISRASDDFRCVPMPDPTVRPCQQAIWDDDAQGWCVNLLKLGHLMELINGDERLIVTNEHVVIDDIRQ